MLLACQCFSYETKYPDSTIHPDGTISISANLINASCFNRVQPYPYSGLGDGAISATATGGIPPYTYELVLYRPPQDTGYFPRLSSGNYLIVAKDAAGNTGELQVYLADTLPQPLLGLNVLQAPTSCTAADGSYQLIPYGGTPPYIYSVDGGLSYSPTNNIVNNLQQGSQYMFLMKDANGCLAVASPGSTGDGNAFMCKSCCYLEISIMIDKLPCGDDGQVTASVNNSGSPVYYSLDGVNYQLANSTNNNLNIFSNLAPGVYHMYAKNTEGFETQSTFTMSKACSNYVDATTVMPGCKQTNGSITITANFGTAPYQYSINGSNTGKNVFTNLAAGIYKIVVKDALGETNSVTVSLKENCPIVTATAGSTTCNKQDGTITASGSNGVAPYLFSIDGITFQAVNIFTGLSSGSYTVTLKDGNGNKDSVKIAVAVGNCLQVTANAVNPSCGNSNGAVTITVTSGVSPYQYSKDGINFISENIFSTLAPGNFIFTVKDAAGATGIVAVTLLNIPAPQASGSAIQASCNNTNGTITVTVVNGKPPYQYSIDNGISFQTSNLFNGLDSGLYQLIVKDSNECNDTTSIRVTAPPKPIAFLGNDSTLCNGDSLLLQLPLLANHQYQWQDNSIGNTYQVKAPGLYTVTVTNQYNCTAIDTVQIFYKSLPKFSLGNDVTSCSNQQISLSPSPAVQGDYLWSNGSNTSTINVTASGQYWLTVNDNGCLFRDTVQVVVKPAPVLNLGNDTTLCEDQILVLNAAYPNATYLWQDGSTSSIFTVKEQGNFGVQTELNGCVAVDNIDVNYINRPSVNLVTDTSLCITQQLTLNAFFPNARYLWPDGSTQPQYTVTQPGIYSVQVTNLCGSTLSTAVVNFENCNCIFFVPKAFTPDNNGKNDLFKPSYQCLFTNYSFRIFNRFGEAVFNTSNPSAGWNGMFKNKQQPIGAYIWLLQYVDKLSGQFKTKKGTVVLIR